ncbi:RelA/SpoT family protein [Roseateles saccharophilus]|uniref:GTP pyrophosphokinase/guanosine-3',5'-bis(Diphosphate) 3'-pyrophosphohydrolase n=2 Tax=Pseudomonadota TaxID=1224 RepID=A0A4R3UPH7_ROSSA|nr:bifunctional (p)ppGpp synthetase/guanosine-3',5'-bis(diphosphate) 3'-pyrophosphohydrolase [Roseateles saccharophilus]MDG0834703.1 bifunctional (p)ppGpp synthetase/guanosine-3',5'-bis(diphosphate) 3'-pyrophosphohydrolase [Roseateles saccharophilus]TCU92641.1 GTP pyrophosphokinase/guanosine-3',5'-bis(diphosphate) 3'-pyrophosphohydrolase [Roseateles saccharophilus]
MAQRSLTAWFTLPGLRQPAPPTPAEAASFDALAPKLGYLSKAEVKRVREAYKFADEAHLGQKRATGEPYITHPIAVAGICAEWRLDAQALMAALMHDVVEDCGVSKTELIEKFDATTADLVDGLTKLDKLQFSTKEESQAESFRKMLLAMARDLRVILVKLADRLHNMRTMGAMAPHKARRIARETFDIYAPIAHRLGLNQTFRELQDLSFQYFHPWRYAALSKAVAKARGNRRDLVSRIEGEIRAAFAKASLRVDVQGREKTVYSIYKKMREKGLLSFAQVSDIFGFRILTEEPLQCYTALGVLHQLYKPQAGRFKDYIANPKDNGYQSLHTTLMGPLGTPLEFQLRTEGMHQIAEQGVAAHWIYKSRSKQASALIAQQANARWLQSLIDIQDETRDANEFLEHVKIDLFPDSIYVFTPKSKIMALPKGATPVDFAYAIHSDVGDHCVAAQVNGEPVPLRAELKSGDIVEIITAPGASPNPAWLSFVRTGRARSKIRHYLKDLEQEESRELGEKMLAQAMRGEGLALPSLELDDPAAPIWRDLAAWAGSSGTEQLLIDIGAGRKIAAIIAKKLARMMAEHGQRPDALALTLGRFAEASPEQGSITVDGSEGASVQLASCCRPIPGDEVRGYLGRGEGLVVHTCECAVGRRLFQRDSEHWIQVEWAEELTRSFEAGIALLLNNGKGVLAQVAQAVAQAEADITHISMSDDAPLRETAEMTLLIAVRDRLHLADVLRVLRRTAPVQRVWRVKPAVGS